MDRYEPTAEEALALAEEWDRCYPGNVNVESVVNGLVAALRGTAERVRELEGREIENAELHHLIRQAIAPEYLSTLDDEATIQDFVQQFADDYKVLRCIPEEG